MKGWDDAPIVDVPRAIDPKHVTLIYPFYCNSEFLKFQLNCWLSYPEELRNYLSAIIVDDGSPYGMAVDVLFGNPKPFPIRLFYIEVDVRFNWIAARNIAMRHAPDGWCLGTDMDHVVPLETAQNLIWDEHQVDCIYRFGRVEYTGEEIHSHPNSWLMTRDMYWNKFGGYDEVFSGYYGTDGEARRRWIKIAKIKTLRDKLVRYEYVGDSSTTRYKRKQLQDVAVKKIIDARGKDWKPKVLSFPFHEVVL